MEFSLENKEQVPVVETVRGALFHRGKFLMLEKDVDSNNPGALEFSGGKIDEIAGKISTLEEQKQAVIDEVGQETKIDIKNISFEKVDEFENYFEVQKPDGTKKQYKRKTHLFLVRLPDDQEVLISVGGEKNAEGKSEDKHAGYKWVSPQELVSLITTLEENETTKERSILVNKNSRRVKKLLESIENK